MGKPKNLSMGKPKNLSMGKSKNLSMGARNTKCINRIDDLGYL
jgi:hypothetical protein